MNGVQTRFKCKLDVKRCKRFVFPPSSLLPRSNALKTKAIRYFQTDRTLTRIVSPPLTYENSSNSNSESDDDYKHHSSAYDFGWNIGHATRDAVIAITAIVFVFGFPLIIVFIIFFFRYKNRKAKYRLVEQALASGQPLPENLFKKADSTDIRSKGIKNVFVGIGLFIFLWAITEEFGLGCIGLLVMFTGFGQLVIYYTQQDRAPKSNDKSDNARTVFPEKNAEK